MVVAHLQKTSRRQIRNSYDFHFFCTQKKSPAKSGSLSRHATSNKKRQDAILKQFCVRVVSEISKKCLGIFFPSFRKKISLVPFFFGVDA